MGRDILAEMGINPDDLVDINDVKINMDLPIEERRKDYIRQIKNPNVYRNGKHIVIIKHSPDSDKSLLDILYEMAAKNINEVFYTCLDVIHSIEDFAEILGIPRNTSSKKVHAEFAKQYGEGFIPIIAKLELQNDLLRKIRDYYIGKDDSIVELISICFDKREK